MAEPTSALTFEDLILEASRLMGTGHYGSDGDEAVQVPTDAHDLAESKRMVNNAIRMFVADAPRSGWNWMKPVDTITLPAQDTLDKNANDVVEYTIDAPTGFAGQFNGPVTVLAGTNQSWTLDWVHEGYIRRLRENESFHVGHPRLVATRIKEGTRAWELLLWPAPSDETFIEFAYDVHFDKLTSLSENPPVPFSFDEAILAAVRAVVERDVFDTMDRHWQYYQQKALPNAYQIDARSQPRRLGYFSNPSHRGPRGFKSFRNSVQRPNVTYDTG